MDDDGNQTLSKAEFFKGMSEEGLGLTSAECNALFTYLDRDKSGGVEYEEFLSGIRVSRLPNDQALSVNHITFLFEIHLLHLLHRGQ